MCGRKDVTKGTLWLIDHGTVWLFLSFKHFLCEVTYLPSALHWRTTLLHWGRLYSFSDLFKITFSVFFFYRMPSVFKTVQTCASMFPSVPLSNLLIINVRLTTFMSFGAINISDIFVVNVVNNLSTDDLGACKFVNVVSGYVFQSGVGKFWMMFPFDANASKHLWKLDFVIRTWCKCMIATAVVTQGLVECSLNCRIEWCVWN